jgi:ribA/ribD-fused uncharacterized protein
MKEKFTFFWQGSVFSQWSRSHFNVKSVPYTCAEQFMMHQKALLFDDEATAEKILRAKHPREQKKLGREVSPFDKHRWDKVAREIVYQGSHAKFTQNQEMLEQLLGTQGTTLVEASPLDRIWGIGLAEDNPLALDRSTWNGTNWLGEVLTKLRDDLLQEQIK